jgi:hypothetical protein
MHVKKFYKIKAEASGCPCGGIKDENGKKIRECPHDCPTKLKYIADHKLYLDIDLDPEKIVYNEGLRFIAKICLNNLWGHFGMREDFKQSQYVDSPEGQIKILFNDAYKDITQIELDDHIRLLEFREKDEYIKPNKATNIYIALFTTAHARLRLYKCLEILGDRVLYMDTDSIIYIDDGSEACKEVEKMLGDMLGMLTNELKKDRYIVIHVATAPKDYGHELDDGTIKIKNKSIILTSESEEKITLGKMTDFVSDNNTKPETLTNTRFVLSKKDNTITVIQQQKMYDFEFNKRMIVRESEDTIKTLPYGY